MNFTKIFSEVHRNAIKLVFQDKSIEDLPIGTSKFGGNPDIPIDFNWFYYDGENYEGVTKNRPLSFLAQINCEEVTKYDKSGLLPTSGFLYFFYELSTMTWGFDPKDKGSAKVFYFDGKITDLHRMIFPDDMDNEFKLPEIKLEFTKKHDLPCYEEFTELIHYDDWDEYDKQKLLSGYKEEETISKLLGYADIIQNGMLLQCEEVTHGIYCGDCVEIDPNLLNEFEKSCSKWQLLFQLDTVTADDFELMFGDCGRIYFYITKDDLKYRNFDNCWLVLQCD